MARGEDRREADRRQVPLLLGLDPVRRPADRAADLRARLLAALHGSLNGSCPSLRGRRSAAYRRQQLRGLHPITERDLAELAVNPAREAREAVRAFAVELLDEVRPAEGCESIHEAAAAFAQESADVPAAVLRAARDGRYTSEEIAEIRRELFEAEQRLIRVRAAARASVGA